jgi:hypothetical protein
MILEPTATIRGLRKAKLGDAVQYALLWLVIYGIISALLVLAAISGTPFGPLMLVALGPAVAVLVFIWTIVAGIIGFFIGSAWLHLWALAFGARKGYVQTFKSAAYGATPALALGWIPIIGAIFALWGLALIVLGLRELHEISTSRAALAVIVAVIIPAIIVTVSVVMYYLSTAPMMPWYYS